MEYTSTSSPLAVPCSITTQAPWDQIKSLGLREGHWQFFPRSTSDRVSPDAQRLFTLSLEESVWKAKQTRGLTPVKDLKNRDLSLSRTLGRADDRGDYVCTLKFESGVTLSTTVRVNVLESKSVHTVLSAPKEGFLIEEAGGGTRPPNPGGALLLLILLGCPFAQFESS